MIGIFEMGCDCFELSTIIYCVGFFVILKNLYPLIRELLVRKEESPELLEKNWRNDVVYLYQFKGTSTCSSASPFCVKIETFMRLHNISFERRDTLARGSNNQVPFIELNGEHITDSQVIIKRLAFKFKVKEYETLTDAAFGRTIDRMLDNHTFNVMMHWKGARARNWLPEAAEGLMHPLFIQPFAVILGPMISQKIKNRIELSIGRFNEEQYKALLREDCSAILEILGEKKFLFGDKPTTADCTLFSQLSVLYWLGSCAGTYPVQLIDSQKFVPLKKYLERMRDTVFGSEFHT